LPSGRSRSPRSLPVSRAGTCTLSGAPKMGGCSGVPAAARSAKASTAGSGTRPAPRPCRRTGQAPGRCAAPTICAMPHCRCGWPPAPRPPRSRPAPGTACMSCSPPTPTAYRPRPDRQPAHRASPPPQPLAPRWPTRTGAVPGIPSVMRPCHSWTQRDTTGPDPSGQIRLDVLDLRKCRLKTLAHRPGPRAGRSRAPALHTPLTSQDLAHNWPTATGNGLPDRSRTRIRPGIREHRHRV
jgi:hypothetical protein